MEDALASRWTLRSRVGADALGEVWLADDAEGGAGAERVEVRRYALATLGPGVADRLERQARAAQDVRDDRVVPVLGVVRDDTHLSVVGTHVAAGTLAARLTVDGPLGPEAAASVGHELAAALAALHGAGVVHGGIDPAQVRLDGPRVLLAGVAHAGVLRTTPGSSPATALRAVAFAAPEVLDGVEPDPAADVWSLGAVLHAAVEGHPPYADPSPPPGLVEPADGVRSRARDDRRTPLAAARALAVPLERLLARDPAARPSAARAAGLLAAPLAGAGDTVEVSRVEAPLADAPAEQDDTEQLPTETAEETTQETTREPRAVDTSRRLSTRILVGLVALLLVVAASAGGWAYATGRLGFGPLSAQEERAVETLPGSLDVPEVLDQAALTCAAADLVRTDRLRGLRRDGLVGADGGATGEWTTAQATDFYAAALDCADGWAAPVARQWGLDRPACLTRVGTSAVAAMLVAETLGAESDEAAAAAGDVVVCARPPVVGVRKTGDSARSSGIAWQPVVLPGGTPLKAYLVRSQGRTWRTTDTFQTVRFEDNGGPYGATVQPIYQVDGQRVGGRKTRVGGLDPWPRPKAPKVQTTAGYRAVTFRIKPRTRQGFRIAAQVRLGDGWRRAPASAVRPTAQGGRRVCLEVRSVAVSAERGRQTGPAREVCGTSQAPALRVVATDQRCGRDDGCAYYAVYVAGLRSATGYRVRVYNARGRLLRGRRVVTDDSGRASDLLAFTRPTRRYVVSVGGLSAALRAP
ncbi:MAG: hypothetical protein CMH83_18940 [Nocardioides sp.]|nr:hypothetical protein [Nocardioides sp.]